MQTAGIFKKETVIISQLLACIVHLHINFSGLDISKVTRPQTQLVRLFTSKLSLESNCFTTKATLCEKHVVFYAARCLEEWKSNSPQDDFSMSFQDWIHFLGLYLREKMLLLNSLFMLYHSEPIWQSFKNPY